ncbi:fatty acid-binding protein DegV [Sporanaerobium hydrogeniformans]|uniref:Fatty acid-binding protein DegV n=1 Tax=Sporanaerobium hydrogeniformans TaxID=3072179 RepID=A0AC61DAQ1_9FIRM|nr:DegV family protein [Sporanaerobium hydrogeniformans]PHV70107.1 fatty acid-binding protein DegV [Sporanaerobium hydrogeniformans]
MNKEKIAIMVDSCTDVPKEYREKYNMYVIPLMIIYKDKEYYDGIDITPEDVYARFAKEIPSTSLPSPEITYNTFKKIQADGYKKVIVISISSGLSNTYSMVSSTAKELEELEICVIDTKNIGIGAGFSAIMAGELIEKGLDFKTVCQKVQENVEHTRIYFCVSTLEYLKKGGRIGLVTSILGTALDLKPIISCNEEGVYYTVAKVRGRVKSLKKAQELAVNMAKNYEKYNITIMHGNAKEEADKIAEELKTLLPGVNVCVEGQITPALIVHTGPGLIGIGVQRVNW